MTQTTRRFYTDRSSRVKDCLMAKRSLLWGLEVKVHLKWKKAAFCSKVVKRTPDNGTSSSRRRSRRKKLKYTMILWKM